MKYYEYGFSKIHPLTPKNNEDWDYLLQHHKSKSGKHFDVRLRRPGESTAHSWAIKKLPTHETPARAFRTKDHPSIYAWAPEHARTPTKDVKVLQRGKARMQSIDKKTGLTFTHNKQTYRLRPHKGKQYYLELINEV